MYIGSLWNFDFDDVIQPENTFNFWNKYIFEVPTMNPDLLQRKWGGCDVMETTRKWNARPGQEAVMRSVLIQLTG